MKTMSADEFKAHFSDVIDEVKAGEEIAVTNSETHEIIGHFIPEKPQKSPIKLGIMQGKAKFTFAPDFKMTEEEFLGS